MIDVYIIVFAILLFLVFKFNLLRKFKLTNLLKLKYLFVLLPFITMFLETKSLTNLNLLKTVKVKKRKVSETTKKVVAANQKWHCAMCQNILDASYEIDHIVPLYKGGDNSINNLQALCRNCHGKKTIYDKLNL